MFCRPAHFFYSLNCHVGCGYPDTNCAVIPIKIAVIKWSIINHNGVFSVNDGIACLFLKVELCWYFQYMHRYISSIQSICCTDFPKYACMFHSRTRLKCPTYLIRYFFMAMHNLLSPWLMKHLILFKVPVLRKLIQALSAITVFVANKLRCLQLYNRL